MESSRLVILIAAASLAVPVRLHASGGFFDVEPPHNLAGDLDRLPAKPLGTILMELDGQGKSPAAEDSGSALALPAGFLERIGKERPGMLVAEIDRLVAQARADYEENREVLPALYDVRDVIATPGPSDEVKRAYCETRLAHAPEFRNDGTPAAEYAKDDPLRPHLLYQQGAGLFQEGGRLECIPWFGEIVACYPQHPRAEGARFLLARCALSASREDGLAGEELAQAKSQALSAFQDYLKLYPAGRYVADAHGWIGALLWQDQPAEALKHYLAQFDDQAHPECRGSAAHMIERVLGRMVGVPDELNQASLLRVLAQHPQVAQAAVYFVLNAPEIHPSDGRYDQPAALRAWRLRVLPMLASAVAEEKARYTGPWSLRMRAMLAQAASAEGRQEEALKLAGDSPGDLTNSDDLLFARIVALQRARRPGDAVLAARLFLATFPESPLREGVRIRLANALVDSHRAGEALIALYQIENPQVDRWHGDAGIYPPAPSDLASGASAVYPDTQGYDAFEDLKTTIIEFAPLSELEAVLQDPAWGDKAVALASLKEHLALRKASREDFAGAASLLRELPDAERQLQAVEQLNGLKTKVESASAPQEKSSIMIALGDAFAGQDLPSCPLSVRGINDHWLAWRENAGAVGYRNPNQELEGRHPLRHATKYWLAAARQVPGTSLSAQVRLKILEGLERIALTSEYDFARAMESQTSDVSRQIYNVLLRENPRSPEARAAAWLDFSSAPVEPDEYMSQPNRRGETDSSREVEMVRLLGGYRFLAQGAFGEFEPCRYGDDPSNPALDPIRESLKGAAKDLAHWDGVITPPQVEAWLRVARPAAANAEQVKVVNLLEDLGLFLRVEGVPAPIRQGYVQARLLAEDLPQWYPAFNNGQPEPDPRNTVAGLLMALRGSASAQKIAGFLDYLELYVNEADRGSSRDYEPVYPTYHKVEEGCHAFLKRYPGSVRREACYLLLMRAVFRQMPERWIHAPPPEGAEESEEGQLVETDEPFRPGKLLKVIEEYEKEFPRPRYAAEVRNFRGNVAWRMGDFGTALDLTLAQLDDMTHLDLRREASIRLANIFADLRDHQRCVAVLEAVKSRPPARERLEAWMAVAAQFADHPLRCRTQFVREQLRK